MLEILHSEPFSIKMVQWIVYIITQYTSQYEKRPHCQCASENYNMHPAQSRVYEAEQLPKIFSIISYDFFSFSAQKRSTKTCFLHIFINYFTQNYSLMSKLNQNLAPGPQNNEK